MKNLYPTRLLFLAAIALSALFNVNAQGPGSLFVDAGPDTNIPCGPGNSVNLTADFLETFETISETYTVDPILYAPPFLFSNPDTSLNPNIDDRWSGVEALPFDFCFFGQLETQVQVGSNGVVRFEVDAGDTSNGWSFNENLPNNTNPTLGEGNVFLPVHDIDPSASTTDEIGYSFIGTFPNRVLVVTYFEVPMFSCTNLLATQMVVFYEFSNVIEVYIQDKPSCNTWQNGATALGIQNNAGDIAFVPPGRNTSDSPYTLSNEAWRFTPDGVETYVFEWLDPTGTVIGTTPTITVAPGGPTIYTARVTYTNTCNGDVVVLEDDVLVTPLAPFTVDLGPDIDTCDNTTVLLTADTMGTTGLSYEWFYNAVSQGPSTIDDNTFMAPFPDSGTYTVSVFDPADPSCVLSDDIEVNFNLQPVIAAPAIDLFQCDDGTGTGVFNLRDNDVVVLGTQDPLEFSVTYHNSAADATAGTPEIAMPTAYPITGVLEEIWVRIENSSGTCFEIDSFFIEYRTATAGPMTDISVCDPEADGSELVDLAALKTAEALGAQSAADYTVTFHDSQADADSGMNVLANPYLVTGPVQTIYVRVQNNASAACGETAQFDVTLIPTPVANQPDDLFQCDDGSNTGVFDLTVNDAVVLGAQDPATVNISYYNSLVDANAGMPQIATPTAYPITGTMEEIFVRIEDLTGQCFSVDSFFIEFSPVIIQPLTDENFCDQDSDGFVTVDLPALKDAEALGTQNPANFTVSYHNTLPDASTGANPLPAIYIATGPSEVIYVRVQNNSVITCADFTDFTINIFEAPIATPVRYDICDELPNDGFATFDLPTRDDEITGMNPDASVTYFTTFAGAQAGIFPIFPANAYINTDLGFQIIFARVDNINVGGCFNIVPVELQVNDSPAITDPISDYFLCDLDGDGLETFDLTTKDAEILNTLVDVDLSYHESQADADANIDPITPADAYLSSNAVVWVRAVNFENGEPTMAELCTTVSSFNLILGQVPVFNVVPEITTCDDDIADGLAEFDLNSNNATITGGNPNLTVTYYSTLADAELPISALPVFYTNMANPEAVWVRVEDNATGCYGIFESELVVIERPEIFQPDDLIYCDDDNDGFGFFTLEDATEQAVGGTPAGNIVVSYHLTQPDADNNVLPLVSPYDNEVPFAQIVFIRVTDLATGCYSTIELTLRVEQTPQIMDPDDLVVCDTDGDGLAVFNLTDVEPQMLMGLTGGPYVVTYFSDMAQTSPIGNPLAFTNTTNPQTIFITVRDTDNDCTAGTTVELRVEIPPVLVNPTPLELCDGTEIFGPDDQTELFDLTLSIPDITGGALGISITFFETLADMQANTNAIAIPTAYQNTANPQTIYFSASDVNSSCTVDDGMVTLDLIVNPLPSPVTPEPLEACDIDNDGFTTFNLTDKDIEIVGGEPGVVITYHETETDAQNGTFALTDPYANIVADGQIVYARATYDDVPPATGTGCFRVVELELIVNPTPEIPVDLDPLVICDGDGDGTATFDLTERAVDIYGTQDPADYTLNYFTSLAGAQAGTPAIGTPTAFTNTVNPQPIWVRLDDSDTECSKVGTFELQVSLGPVVVQPLPLELCDDLGGPNDGIADFDLTVKNGEITGGAPGVGVQYFENQVDADGNINAINPATAYTNTSNPQTIFVRVTDGNTLCADTTVTLTLRVLPNPVPEQPDPIALCDVVGGDGTGVFDLTIREAQILDGNMYDITYYELESVAIAGTVGTEIVDPTMYTNTGTPQIIYVRVVNPDSPLGCFEIVELVISVELLPDDSAVVEDYILCDVPFDGLAIFDLTTRDAEILIGQDMVNNQVSYYGDQMDAMAGINPIVDPTMYQNTSNPQMIYVGIRNTATGCYMGGAQFFDIEVREGATATPPAGPYVICDNTGPSDGLAEFDLSESSADPVVLALIAGIYGGQDPMLYQLTFHGTLETAMDGTNALVSPYTNIINPQVIYARVEDLGTECSGIAEVVLKVEQLPVVVLPESFRLCVDADGLPIPQEEGEDSPPFIDTGLDPSLYTFVWDIDGEEQVGETSPGITALEGGVYTVTITENESMCSTTASTTVTVSQAPVAWSFELVNGAFADDHTVAITAEGLGEYIYSIDGGPFQEGSEFTDVSPGLHTITVRDANGCGEISFDIGVVDYPDYFTPNGDGIHETWNIIGIADFDPTANIFIFDRHGKLLKQISPLAPGWDGTYNGSSLPSSDYWFRVEYTEQDVRKEIKGHFTLKR